MKRFDKGDRWGIRLNIMINDSKIVTAIIINHVNEKFVRSSEKSNS